jgi:prephenate dehydrogenase
LFKAPEGALPDVGTAPAPAVQAQAQAAAAAVLLAVPAGSARGALDHYNKAIAKLKVGDWAGFGAELDAMKPLLEDLNKTKPSK